MKKLKEFTMMHAIDMALTAIVMVMGCMLVVSLIHGEWAEAFANICWIAVAIINVHRSSKMTTATEIIKIQDEVIKEICQVNRGTLSKIDIDKFIVTLVETYCECKGIDRTAINTYYDKALEKMGYEVRFGRLEEIKGN